MELKRFYRSLSPEEKEQYVELIGTSKKYMENHLLRPTPTKIPRPEKMRGMADYSGGHVSYLDVLRHFYPQFFDEKKGFFEE